MRGLSIIALAALLAAPCLPGCTTLPVAPANAHPVPSTRIVSLPVVATGVADVAEWTVVRDAGKPGSGLLVLLAIDGRKVAYFETRETLKFTIAAGVHTVAVGPDNPIAGRTREYSIHVAPGAHAVYRISVTEGGVVFQPVVTLQ